MKLKMSWLVMLATALALGLVEWSVPVARGENASTLYLIHWVDGATGVDSGDCNTWPCQTIGYAISQSGSSDVIIVSSGTYTEHIVMKNGASIYGQGWDKTIINGNYSLSQPTVSIPATVDASTVISGVQITGGGTGDPNTSPDGGGIFIGGGSPSIINTWVHSNTGYWGGGVNVSSGSPTFSNVPAWNNRAVLGGGFHIRANSVVTMTSDMSGTNGTLFWNSSTSEGGGLYVVNSTVTLTGLRAWWNTAPDQGGGLYWEDSVGTVNKNSWMSNSVTNTGSMGGGVLVTGTSSLTLEGNWLENNYAVLVGGGMHLGNGANASVNANTIVSNTVAEGGAGVSIAQASAVTFTNNIVARNAGTLTYPSGMNIYGTAARIINNTISDNYWLGVYFHTADGIVIANNIISGNGGWGIYRADGTTPSFTEDYNDIYNNSGGNYYNVAPGAHDLSVNPSFVGTGNMLAYYHLQPASPVGTGGSLAYAPPFDIDGKIRAVWSSMGAAQLGKIVFLPLVAK